MRKLLLLATAALAVMGADKPERGFTSLFNGKDLEGWTKAKENEGTFTVKDGAIVANGPRCHLFYTGPFQKHDFKNFELKVDVMTEAKSNGGIYIQTAYQETGWPTKGFEVQVNNTHTDWRKTGSLYMVQDVRESLEDKKWFTEHIIVKGNNITVFLDGKKVVDWTQPEGFTPPKDMPGRLIASGTIAFQGHDPGSTVYYKNIRIKPLK